MTQNNMTKNSQHLLNAQATSRPQFGVYIGAFLFPTLLMSLYFFVLYGAYPIGDLTILRIDLFHQYVHFYSYFKEALTTSSSFLYSWHSGFGANHIGTLAYYTASPFMFLLLLFPKAYLPEAVALMVLLKVGCMSMAMCYLIRKKFNLETLETVIFSTFYALMAFSVVNYHNVMWLDGLIWLPILVLTIDLLLKEQVITPFMLILSLLFISNFYISYMVGCFIFLYFITNLVQRGQQWAKDQKIKICVKFFLGTLIAAGISAFLTLPTYQQLTTAGSGVTHNGFSPNFNSLVFIQNLFSGFYDSILSGTPYIYVGTFVLLLVPLYFFNRGIALSHKITWGIILGILLVSLQIPFLEWTWHGFASPNNYLYRFSFLVSFVLLYLSIVALTQIKHISKSTLVGLYGFILSGIGLAQWMNVIDVNLVMNLILISLFFVYLLLYIMNYKRFLYILLLIYAIGELTFNSATSFIALSQETGSVPREMFDAYEAYEQAVQVINHQDLEGQHGLYRATNDLKTTPNDGLLLGYSDFNQFNSMLREDFAESINKLGLHISKAVYRENGATVFTDSLLGLSYYISAEDDVRSGYYVPFAEHQNLTLYRNDLALPVGFTVDENFGHITLDDMDQPFENQNKVYQALSGRDEPLFKALDPEQVTTTYENVADIEQEQGRMILTRENEHAPLTIKHTLDVREENTLMYAYITMPAMWKQYLNFSDIVPETYVNGVLIEEYPRYEHEGILDMGTFSQGQVTMTINIDADDFTYEEMQFYGLDISAYPTMVEHIDVQGLDVTLREGNRLQGTVKAENDHDFLFLTIPWDEGWRVKVNGETIQPKKLLGGFMGIPTTVGENDIDMTFIPQGFLTGCITSFVSLILLGLIARKEYVSWKKKTTQTSTKMNL
ncbi:YfhO family protein [Caldalkalibacillus salinus]|uniref:YfhO family protein n=1 Tax=Caldalkalibacillus salinus TaxID=2803787 RepID=UPI0019244DEA|nr:YfhO family protein [Caldalkalibacillus salinus]